MSARLVLPSVLRDCAGGRREVEVHGSTLREMLDGLDADLPVLARRLRDESGAIRPHVLVIVDGVTVRGQDQDGAVRDGAEVFVAPAVSGG